MRGRILCYHSIGQSGYGINDVRPHRFRHHLEVALTAGYRFVPAVVIARGEGFSMDLAVTFDDGLTSVLDTAVPILQDLKIPAECFVVTSWADHDSDWSRSNALDWGGVVALRDAGVEIGSHSLTHPDFGVLAMADAREQLATSKDILEQRLGAPITDFAIPFGQSGNWGTTLTALAREVGYDAVYAQSEHRRPPETTARTFITSVDNERRFLAAVRGAFDGWEEWV